MLLSVFSSPAALASPDGEAAVKTIVESVAAFADRGEFDALERLYAPETRIDYSSLTGASAEVRSPQGLMTEWASVLPGFDRTRHALSNVEAQVHGARATASANVVADHWAGDSHWRVIGRYDYDLVMFEGVWLITSMTFTLEDEIGSRDIFEKAITASSSDPHNYIKRRQTRKAVTDFIEGLAEMDLAKWSNAWAEDAIQHMPCASDESITTIVGRDALVEHYSALAETAGVTSFGNRVTLYPMLDPEMVFAE